MTENQEYSLPESAPPRECILAEAQCSPSGEQTRFSTSLLGVTSGTINTSSLLCFYFQIFFK